MLRFEQKPYCANDYSRRKLGIKWIWITKSVFRGTKLILFRQLYEVS